MPTGRFPPPAAASNRACGSPAHGSPTPPAHDLPSLPAGPYAHLLGLYLGDGCLATLGSGYQLRITMDSRYPRVIGEAADAIRAVAPDRAVGIYPVRGERFANVTASGPSWACLVPQHAPGKKHERPIRLEPWQLASSRPRPGDSCAG